ncbi:glutaredoxin family protein [Cryobacterium melibiosiphilum]|uniref:glutaredoxin family protein n=1 Tax=Cryobacterium melibiosiphilum TaxID=995039 RepID=UPI001F16CC74|nr:glutaredoxin family protein [Cryobacterium melibiosiphilum]
MLTVTVYTTGPSCIRCKMTKDVLTKKGVEFVEVDIRDNPAAHEYVTEELGYTAAPVVVVEDGTGEDHWCEFRPDQIERVAKANQAEAYAVPVDPMDELGCESCQ